MAVGETLTRAQQRLKDELEDDGVAMPFDERLLPSLLQELDHVRRPPVHERRVPLYGSFILPPDGTLARGGDLVDLIELDMPLEECRRFSDGRLSYLVRYLERKPQLACYRRSVQLEADLIEIQEATGVTIVQRTVMGVPRMISADGVIEWTGRVWSMRPSARRYRATLERAVPEARPDLIAGLLHLCIHWLSPSRVGSTLLLHLDVNSEDITSLDLDSSLRPPALSIGARHHYPALVAALMQTDLATLISAEGCVKRIGVGLRSTTASDAAVAQDRGMRHRSAARYTWDHPHTVAFVVSDDGPVTVFRHGVPVTIACSMPQTGEIPERVVEFRS
jgi:hypothetical protein